MLITADHCTLFLLTLFSSYRVLNLPQLDPSWQDFLFKITWLMSLADSSWIILYNWGCHVKIILPFAWAAKALCIFKASCQMELTGLFQSQPSLLVRNVLSITNRIPTTIQHVSQLSPINDPQIHFYLYNTSSQKNKEKDRFRSWVL
jgi:hypothetical protein